MWTSPTIDPVAFYIGSWAVYWYGLMYLVGFAATWFLGNYRLKRSFLAIDANQLSDLLFYSMLGVIIGGRLGYMFFYDTHEFFSHPWQFFYLRQGGMSFHGGLLGVLCAFYCFSKRSKIPFFAVSDFIAPMVPIGLGFGRLGNFINGELWGRVTDVPWGLVLQEAGVLPRHPSQLYQMFLEGLLLFICLWCYSAKRPPQAAVSGLFLLLYGVFRCFVEFYRQPDSQMGFYLHYFTMGQVLSLPLILCGGLFIFRAYRAKKTGGA